MAACAGLPVSPGHHHGAPDHQVPPGLGGEEDHWLLLQGAAADSQLERLPQTHRASR